MKKILSLVVLFGFFITFTPSFVRADFYSGAISAVVLQAPTASCGYGILADNTGTYDIIMDYGYDLNHGDYLYGGLGLGTDVVYNASTKRGVRFFMQNNYYYSWSSVVSAYYSYCPNF